MEDKKRRDVLKWGATAGLAALAGAAKFITPDEDQPITECSDKVKLLSQDGEIVEVEASMLKLDTHDHAETMAKNVGREGIPGRKFVMVIDLGKCRNARKCVTACQKMHYLPEDKEWLQVKLMKDNPELCSLLVSKDLFSL